MKGSTKTSFKIGLLTLAVIVAMVVIALGLGLRTQYTPKVSYYTYLDESVTGLDVGAQVKYRGLPIGTVDHVRVIPEGRLVEVTAAILPEHTWLLDWRPERDNGLRASTSFSGVSGAKVLDLDHYDPHTHPPPELPFQPPAHYVPSSPSLMNELLKRVTAVTEKLVATLAKIDGLVDTFVERDTPRELGETLSSVRSAAGDLRATLQKADKEHLFPKARQSIENLDAAVASIQRLVDRAGGDGGLLDDAEHATESVDAFGLRAKRLTDDLDRTLRDLSDAAHAFRTLADALERDPDMLLKGRASAGSRR